MKIDAHQHFWIYNAGDFDWISDETPILKKNWLPKDIEATLTKYGITGVIAVQARQSLKENEFLLELAEQYDLIKGIIGWIDIRADSLSEYLEVYNNTKIKGFRHLIQDEQNPTAFFKDKRFNDGMRKLLGAGFIYELLFKEKNLEEAIEFCQHHDNSPLVIDHLGKPNIYKTDFENWKNKIRELARLPHVYCKLSGLITEAGEHWSHEKIIPFIETAIDCFTPERLLYGSDWPVCQTVGGYKDVYELIEVSLQSLTENEQEMIMGKNSYDIYKIK